MSKLRDDIGKIYGIYLSDDYDLGAYFRHISITGAIDQKRINETIIVLIKEVEELKKLHLQPTKSKPTTK